MTMPILVNNKPNRPRVVPKLIMAALLTASAYTWCADHNDPNAVNSIYADVPLNPADLYDIFGYPSDDKSNGEALVAQLTFAPKPATGLFDPDMMYKIHLAGAKRAADYQGDHTLEGMLTYVETLKK